MNEQLLEVLNKQVTAEYAAALVYTQLSYDLETLSLSGMSTWMSAQADEERVHAEKIAKHILDRGERVQLGTIEVPTATVGSALEAFEFALAEEKQVSEMIRNLARVSDDVRDYDSRSLIDWFLTEQIEEEATVDEIVDQIKMVDNDGSGLLRIDNYLGAARTPVTGA